MISKQTYRHASTFYQLLHYRNTYIKFMFIIIMVLFYGCIKPYQPNFKNDSVNKYVVQGMISSEEGWQEIDVSRSSAMYDVQYIPVEGCSVEIIDDQEQKFELFEYEPGKYKIWMTEEYLVAGRAYRVYIQTSDGVIIESDYDYMPTGPEVNDIYYEIEDIVTNNPEESMYGIQFYINLDGNMDQSRHYRWRLTETWEYHAAYPREFYYDGQVRAVIPPDYSQIVCYNTRLIDEIFTLSTKNFNANAVQDFPLNYVKNTTSRLAILYCLLIEQIALSEEAYQYWEQLKQNTSETGGLYSTQPIAVKGNLHNISNPDEEVLGFFQSSWLTKKRIFVDPIPDLELVFSDRCSPFSLDFGYQEISPRDYPVYLFTINGQPTTTRLNDECVFCTMQGGVTEKPDYWPRK